MFELIAKESSDVQLKCLCAVGLHASRTKELIEQLKIRGKSGTLVTLRPNRTQREYARNRSLRNIVLKARQLGMTTYIAAQFFVNTITHPGTLSVQVAHDQESAEEIFRMVHRFLENLPERLRKGALRTSRANVRSWYFRDSTASTGWRQRRTRTPAAGLPYRTCTVRRWPAGPVEEWKRWRRYERRYRPGARSCWKTNFAMVLARSSTAWSSALMLARGRRPKRNYGSTRI